MVTRIGTSRRKTRNKFKRHASEKGKIPLSKYFQKFEVGDRVGLKINSAIQKGQFFRRFHGMAGKVSGLKGTCYKVDIKDGGKEKVLFVHPIHLIRLK
ncbi:50S ribosomal protein L21e [archaeon]|jgi:large subunit ribosomal protein L21e|nr:50S ribosomal protein L21e [archaeon]MBT3450427.1 50S ribosomal protein L21e [archaeon]MBT6869170.1 50S ribosomal protein L21e [archaeon]MBT7192817.1 50S ribosomal protein L21e [archaeon]MBT7381357.1 50S ribosomal protein L21e [archaeon]